MNIAVVTSTSKLVEPTSTVLDSAPEDCLTTVTGCCTVVRVIGGFVVVCADSVVVVVVDVVVLAAVVVGEETKWVEVKQSLILFRQSGEFFMLHRKASVVH